MSLTSPITIVLIDLWKNSAYLFARFWVICSLFLDLKIAGCQKFEFSKSCSHCQPPCKHECALCHPANTSVHSATLQTRVCTLPPCKHECALCHPANTSVHSGLLVISTMTHAAIAFIATDTASECGSGENDLSNHFPEGRVSILQSRKGSV